ncbi:MAG: HEAT repeat domain-containing protein [Pseudomonadota bacterium]|uniref:HEAT repeat domain-containing protein n=1 Tax=Candidatus Desulfatibia profunda TaxID=2841695 RepID=A0A8J6NPC9_9BACT|nr:HEAT repeat domain-containing protein [Candidatus Desulfatibia profunda]MBL7178815.1 HEAT repeat domain-containing protein [Desulfobacterales bacterium]
MMTKRKVIDFESPERLLEKAGRYIESMELFFQEKDRAIPVLLKALKYAHNKLKRNIILLLGGFAKQEVVWSLYQIMMDPQEDEEVRHFASVQLSVTLPFLKERQILIDKLLGALKHYDPEVRMNAAFALGWEGNAQAAIPLIELLYDTDIQVQQTAVNALSNFRDDRIFNLMLERLQHGPLEQQRCILYNLWRFYGKHREVEAVYSQYLKHRDADLRLDALVLLGLIARPETHLAAYLKCLKDSNPRIRAMALKQIGVAGLEKLAGLKDEIKAMLSDSDMEVKQAAIKILKKCEPVTNLRPKF